MTQKFYISDPSGKDKVHYGMFKTIAGVPCFIDTTDEAFDNIQLPDAEKFYSVDHRITIRSSCACHASFVIPKSGTDAHKVALEMSRMFPTPVIYLVACTRHLALYNDGACIYSKNLSELYNKAGEELCRQCCYMEDSDR